MINFEFGPPKTSLLRSLKLFGITFIVTILAFVVDDLLPGEECTELSEERQFDGADSKCTTVWGTTYYEYYGDDTYERVDHESSYFEWFILIAANGSFLLGLFFFTASFSQYLHRKVSGYNEKIKEKLRKDAEIKEKKKLEDKLLRAKEREAAKDYNTAILIWEELGEIKEAARVRTLQAEQGSVKVSQKVVHGDEVTEIKDSVLNRSNVGSGGDDKLTKIKELKELHDAGAIDDDEFKQMKKEILGK